MIGGAIAYVVFQKRVHIGYLAAIVAASNAGGSGSVVGDTTTTLMWIDGVDLLNVLHAYVAAGSALIIFGVVASLQQDKYQRIVKDSQAGVTVAWGKLGVVALILVSAIITNYAFDFPALGVWVALLAGAFFVKTPWSELKNATAGTIFLMGLVTSASLMPVDELPPASWVTTFFLVLFLLCLTTFRSLNCVWNKAVMTGACWPMPSDSEAQCCGLGHQLVSRCLTCVSRSPLCC